ncbi:MAG: hypothetical protein ACP5SI_06935 [Chloroflexia bacterium]
MTERCALCEAEAGARCSVCGKPLCTLHVRRALPYLSVGEFLGTVFRTLAHAPGTLLAVLTEEEEEEPFCPECVVRNARRRTVEQRKFLLLVLGAVVVIGGVVYLLVR